MSAARRIAILLAAGAGARFGGDKLGAMLGEESVLARSAAALAASGCDARVAVVSATSRIHEPLLIENGFHVLVNLSAAEGIASSIRAGVGWAEARGAGAALIALADMPFVPAGHFVRLFEKAEQSSDGLSYSAEAGRRMPPAVFSSRWFAALRALEGDSGARALLEKASASDAVEVPESVLDDIDLQEHVERFNR